jgi:TonB family protein
MMANLRPALLLSLLLSFSSTLFCQDNIHNRVVSKDDVAQSSMWGQVGDQMLPRFFVNSEGFKYPEEALKNRVQGQVDVGFQVNKEGHIIDSTIQVITGLSKELDEEAIKILENAPARKRWLANPNIKYLATFVFRITEANWANYYQTLGSRAYQIEDYEKAIEHFILALSFDDKDAKTYYSLYSAYSKIGNSELACQNLKKAKRRNPGFRAEWKSECR